MAMLQQLPIRKFSKGKGKAAICGDYFSSPDDPKVDS
jgi:hypothetical protein